MATVLLFSQNLLAGPFDLPAQRSNGADNPVVSDTASPGHRCRWWERLLCEGHTHSEGLPPDASLVGAIITVDTSRNIAYLFLDGQLVVKSPAATGMDKLLEKGSRKWLFRTPRGRVTVLRKIVNPIWTKPDWAFVEEGKPIPSMESPKRKVAGKLGKFALDLGDGILIHGTDDPSSLGKKASHGCIRLPDKMLETVFRASEVGTEVYVF